MDNEIYIRVKSIVSNSNKLNDGYSKVHWLAIQEAAQGILRVCLKELGGYENNLPKFTNTPPPPSPKGKFRCQYCNLEFNNERRVLAHQSEKHRALWKQTK